MSARTASSAVTHLPFSASEFATAGEVKAIRARLALTQAQLGERLGVGPETMKEPWMAMTPPA